MGTWAQIKPILQSSKLEAKDIFYKSIIPRPKIISITISIPIFTWDNVGHCCCWWRDCIRIWWVASENMKNGNKQQSIIFWCTGELHALSFWSWKSLLNLQIISAAANLYVVHIHCHNVFKRVTSTSFGRTESLNLQSKSSQHNLNDFRAVHLLRGLCTVAHGCAHAHAETIWTCFGVLVCGDWNITTRVQSRENIIPVTTVTLKSLH